LSRQNLDIIDINMSEVDEIRTLLDKIEQVKAENQALETELEEASTTTVLTYFHGRGRAEQARFMLAATNTPFKNKCLDTHEELEAMRASGKLAFGQLPLLEVDGVRVVQSQTINRYLARRGGLYGSNDSEAMQCDMIADGVADFMGGWLGFPFSADKDAFVEEKSKPTVAKYAPKLEAIVSANKGSVYSVGSQLTYADVVLADVCTSYTELLGEEWIKPYPALMAIRDLVCRLPSVSAYLASDKRHAFPHSEVGKVYRENVDLVLGR
jgi:glutathione S-transferase